MLATSGSRGPHCSLMSCIAEEDGGTVHLATLKNTRKYVNMFENENVSLLFDTRDECPPGLAVAEYARIHVHALTLTCIARELVEHEEKVRVLKRLGEAHPQIRAIVEDPDVAAMALEIRRYQLQKGALEAFVHEAS